MKLFDLARSCSVPLHCKAKGALDIVLRWGETQKEIDACKKHWKRIHNSPVYSAFCKLEKWRTRVVLLWHSPTVTIAQKMPEYPQRRSHEEGQKPLFCSLARETT